jgi:long-chain acyl-CoA synthetase
VILIIYYQCLKEAIKSGRLIIGLVPEGKCLSRSHVSLQAILSQVAADLPEKIAIVYGSQKFTYRELEEFSSKFACALVELGVVQGDRVALFLRNSPQFVIAYFGALKAGALVTSVNSLHSEGEVKWQLCDSGAQTIVVLDVFYPIVEKIRDQTALKNVIVVTTDIYSKTVDNKISLDVLDFGNLIKKDSYKQSLDLMFNPDEALAVLQYTGGTTGTPKGVMLTHSNLVSNARSFAAWLKGTSEDVFLSVLPFFHVYGMTTSMITPVSLGAEMVLLPKFDPVKSLQAIAHHKITIFCGSPTMYSILLANTEFKKCDLSSIRVCISGASPLPAHIQKRFIQAGVFIAEGYGLTEASPVTHCTPIDTSIDVIKIGSIGVPLPDTETRIVDLETGRKVLAAGERGELAVRGPQVMFGYWQRPDETAQVLSDDGWLLTGDIAYVDRAGYFFIVDRKKDLIKHKDYSVYPIELEEILYKHSSVKFCAVVGKQDLLSGEVPKAFVVLKEGVKISNSELLEFVNCNIAAYKAIKEIEFCQELPISSSDKILKRALKS